MKPLRAIVRVFFATALVTLVAPPVSAAEVLVWHGDGVNQKTVWVQVDGAAKVVASRDGAVVSDGSKLWAVEQLTREVKNYGCEVLEMDDLSTAEPPTMIGVSMLQFRPLLGGKPTMVIKGTEGSSFYGDLDQDDITLVGSIGATVLVNHVESGYGCGAHGYAYSSSYALDAATGKRRGLGTLLAQPKTIGAAAIKKLAAHVRKEECADDDHTVEVFIQLDEVALRADAGKVSGKLTYFRPADAEWNKACDLDQESKITVGDLATGARPSAAATAAIRALNLTGVIGWSDLSLTGEARNRALTAFKTLPAAPKPALTPRRANVALHTERGRKYTTVKDFPNALRAFDRAIRENPSAPRAWSGRGYARMLKGDHQGARWDFNKALTLDADDKFHAAIWYNLGQIHEKDGDKAGARRAYRHSLKLRRNKTVTKALKRVGG